MTNEADIARYAATIMNEIHEDMKKPFGWGKQIPADAGSFCELHDYCDANTYLLDFIPQGALSWDAYMKLCNDVSDAVDKILAAEAKSLRSCPACHRSLESHGPFDGTEDMGGPAHGHEGFGETYMCSAGHWYTLLLGVMVPPGKILTVVE